MVMLMIKFGAYKAAGVVGCVLPPFARTTKLMKKRSIWAASEKRKRKIRFQNHFWLLLPSFVLFSSVFSLPLPLPKKKKALSSLYRTKGRKRERERCRYHRKRLGHR